MIAVQSKTAATPAQQHVPFFNKGRGEGFFKSAEAGTSFFTKEKKNHTGIQNKLNIGQPNDIYEKEADAVADKVVQRLASGKPDITGRDGTPVQTKPVAAVPVITPFVQTKCASCEQEEKLQKKEDEDDTHQGKKLQKKPIFESNAEPPDDTKNIRRKCADCEKEEKFQKKKEDDEKGMLQHKLQTKPIFESNAEDDGNKNLQKKCAACDHEEKLQKKSGSSSPDPSHYIESNLSASKGSGSSLPAETRSQMESSIGSDFSCVKIHTDSRAVQMSKDLGAQAFTHGSDIYFNSGKYDSQSSSGKHLLAHELTHVVQQNEGVKTLEPVQHSGTSLVQREPDNPPSGADTDSGLNATLDKEIKEADKDSDQDKDLLLRALATRIKLLLTWKTHGPLQTAEAMDLFIKDCKKLAETELDTLGAVNGEFALTFYAKGFPLTWSGRIQAALTLGVDPATIIAEWTKSLTSLTELSKTLGPEIFAHGLPVAFTDLGRLDNFQLRLSDAYAEKPSAVKNYAQESIRYMQLKWIYVFAFSWENMVNQISSSVADGSLVPNYLDWKDFVDNKQAILRDLPARAKDRFAKTDEEVQQIQTDAVKLSDGALFVGMASALYSLFGILSAWNDATALFNTALANADNLVAGSTDGDRLIASIRWGIDNDYFGGARSEAFQNLIDQGPEILLTLALIIILQAIPFVDIALDIYLAYTAAKDVIGMLEEFRVAINQVMKAKNVGELQIAAARLAVILTAGAITILIVLITLGIGKGVKKLKARAAELRAADKDLSVAASEKKALEELSEADRKPFDEGPAKLAKQLESKFKEFASFCRLGSINCREVLPPQVEQEAGAFPKKFGIKKPEGPFKVQKSILADVDRDTQVLRDLAKQNRKNWPHFDKALAEAEKKGLDWVYEGVDKKGNPIPWEVHHNKPVFMGGGNEADNLIPLSRPDHQLFTNWWNSIHRAFKKRFTPAEWDAIYMSEKDVPGSKVPLNPKR